MRALGAAVAVLLAACSSQPPAAQATPSPSPSPSPVALCRLPVYWVVNRPSPPGVDVHAAFISIPGGTVTDVGNLPEPPTQALAGAAYLPAANRWIRAFRPWVSPDGSKYAYGSASPSVSTIHVVDIATGTDRTVYSGSTFYVIVSYEADAIYLSHAINPRQGVFEKLYRLDPAGGTPTLVTGSNRHMDQWGWVLISDGSAWGNDSHVNGNDYTYTVLQLNLSTGQVTPWMTSAPNDLTWPLGIDSQHRLYVEGNQAGLWRLASAGYPERLDNPGPVSFPVIGAPGVMQADSNGEWFAASGAVWRYRETGAPTSFAAGSQDDVIYPAGPCT
jgi:hypothetical protein